MKQLKERIKKRISELEKFKIEAENECKRKGLKWVDWFEVGDNLYDKYNLPRHLCSDGYYDGDVIDNILFELKKLIADDE